MNFSHQEYSSILEAFEGRWCSFFDVSDQPFVLMRHDVEFSVERAFELGELENRKGVKSTFNFQVCCDTYNVASNVSREKIRSLANFGHTIGLHFYASHIEESNFEVLEKELIRQTKILEDATDLNVKTFSFHRPKSWMLKDLRDDQLAGLINQYGKSFFEFSENPEHIKYIADSRHTWDYGHPADFINNERVQVLTHPDEWSREGLNEEDNFRAIKHEIGIKVSEAFLDESPRNFAKYVGKI